MDTKFYRKDIRTSQFAKKVLALLKNKRFVVRFIIVSALFATVLFGSHGIIQRVRLTLQKSDLQEKIRAAEKDTKRLQAESRALDGDAKAIEKVARERHGMIREGETVYKVNRK